MLVILAADIAHAAKAWTPKPQLEKAATHILVGKVRSVSSSTNTMSRYEVTSYIAEIGVDAVEKGSGLKPGDVVRVRYTSNAWLGPGPPPPHDSGHRQRPRKDDYIRVYLVNQGYNGAGYTTDGGYDVYYNNGFEILASPGR